MRRYYSEEEREFLKAIVPGKLSKDIVSLFHERFGVMLTEGQLSSIKNKLGIKSGVFGGRFEKGQIPFNKDKTWDEIMPKESQVNCLKTTFKQGGVPHNHRPIGSERLSKDGYVEIKVAEPKKWKSKHVYVWEQANGKKPKGSVIIFADGDKTNINLDNLLLVSRAELARLNQKGLIFDNAECTKSGLVIAKVLCQIGKIKRNGG